MTTYVVAIETEGSGREERPTTDLEDALDWFTNACTAVMDEEDDVIRAELRAGRVLVGVIAAAGVTPDPGGEVVEMRRAG